MAVEVFLSGPLVPSLPWLSPPHTQKKGLHGMQLETSFFPNSPGFDREILPEMGQLGILGATIKGQFGSGMSAVTMYSFTLVYSCTLLHTLVYSCILLYTSLTYFHIFWYTVLLWQGMAVLVLLLWHTGLLQGRWRGKG